MRRATAAAAVVAVLVGAPAAHAQSAGGHLDVLSVADVDSLDPGYWYYQYDYMALGQTTQRWLYAWEPGQTTPTPDVAAAMPQTSADGRTVTITIRPGIHYSAPLSGRSVTSADVAYALTRDLEPRTGNGYAGAYYAVIKGARNVLAGRTQKLAGVETPDATTLVLHLTRPSGAISTAQALALPGTIPVPEDYARRYDRGRTSTYGEHQVFTGPYLIERYDPGRTIELARNPDYNGHDTGDFRPAYLDTITFHGGRSIATAEHDILDGTHLVNGDFTAPTTDVLRTAPAGQLTSVPAGSVRFIALNTRIRPFGNVNVRRAVAAVIDKGALQLTRGGAPVGSIATHVLPAGFPGYEDAGGGVGPDLDFTQNLGGNLSIARGYLSKAGYRGGRYRGRALLMVGDNRNPARATAKAVAGQIRQLGFRVRLRLVSHPTMLSRFCSRPRAAVAICPNLGWGKDFFDAQSFLDPLFNGANIARTFNSNYAQVHSRRINRELDQANALSDPAARARLYGQIDREVTSQAYLIPWLWDNDVLLRSRDVNGVISQFNSAWDLTFTAVQ